MPEKMRRVTFNIPESDLDVWAWLDAQDNNSISFRLLIKEDIASHGVVDVLTRGLDVKRMARYKRSYNIKEKSDDDKINDLKDDDIIEDDVEAVNISKDKSQKKNNTEIKSSDNHKKVSKDIANMMKGTSASDDTMDMLSSIQDAPDEED